MQPFDPDRVRSPQPREGILRGVLALAMGSVLVLASSGAIAALGDTLFPARSLGEGFAQDLSPAAHVFVRLRVLHPMIAIVVALGIVVAASLVRALRPAPRIQILSRAVTLLFLVQLGAGLLNVTLLAPVWMQLVHLLLADATWITLVVMAAETQAPALSIMSRKGPAPTSDVPPSTSNVAPVTYEPAGETR
jgi:heme A synthase